MIDLNDEFKKMKKEDREAAMDRDFELMKWQIEEDVQRLYNCIEDDLNDKVYKTDKALLDTTFVFILDVLEQAKKLIKNKTYIK